jgi:hypothetical protein
LSLVVLLLDKVCEFLLLSNTNTNIKNLAGPSLSLKEVESSSALVRTDCMKEIKFKENQLQF